jgi:hypothetical protein
LNPWLKKEASVESVESVVEEASVESVVEEGSVESVVGEASVESVVKKGGPLVAAVALCPRDEAVRLARWLYFAPDGQDL